MRIGLESPKTKKNNQFQTMNELEFNRISDIVKSLTLYNVKTEMVGEKMLITVPDGVIAGYQINKLQSYTADYSFIIRSVGQALTITLW